MERTAELQAEIAQRTKTEQALRLTQDELIQAAKLAVIGQMSPVSATNSTTHWLRFAVLPITADSF